MPCVNANTPAGLLLQTTAEAAVLCLINEQRAAAGVSPLTLNLRLRAAARQHANDARTIKWWAGGGPKVHTNPVTLSTPQDRIRDAGYCRGGEEAVPPNENCYSSWYQGGPEFQGGTKPQAAVDWWMNSSGHRNTLLDPAFTETGVAVVLGTSETGPGPDAADGGVIIVQTFGACSNVEPAHLGEVWSWGRNDVGQVGDGSTTDRHQAVHLEQLDEVVSLAGGRGHSLAARADGSALAWGHNSFGQLGDGTTIDQLAPVGVPSLGEVKAVAAGNIHSLALLGDGTVLAWGGNHQGQLGDGTTTGRPVPVQLELNDVTAISAGWNFSLALTSQGLVYAWGENNFGQLGVAAGGHSAAPTLVAGLSGVTAISAGFEFGLALKADGSVQAWGSGTAGQLGDGTFNFRATPAKVLIPSVSGPISAIASGGMHSLALEQNGQVWVWGNNSYGALGAGYTTGDSSLPVRPVNVYGVTAIAAGFGHCLVLKQDGSVWAWGMNNFGGQLGDNTVTDRSTQVPAMGLPNVVSAIAAGTFHSLAT
jgi:alpha-tubulin suppressor-like RCC1 family protein/uncharacterized protein YkwD